MFINAEHYSDRKHKTKKACSAGRKEGQGYTDYGKHRETHTDIYYRLTEYHCENSDSDIHSPFIGTKSSDSDTAKAYCRKQNNYRKATENSELLTD